MITYYRILDEIQGMEKDIKSFYNRSNTTGRVTRVRCFHVIKRVIPLLKALIKEMLLVEKERRRNGQIGHCHATKTSYPNQKKNK